MNISVWTCLATLLLASVWAGPNQEETSDRGTLSSTTTRVFKKYKKWPQMSNASRELQMRKERAIYKARRKAYQPDINKFRDAVPLAEQLARRHENPHSCRRAYVNSKNYTRRSIMPEYLMCDSWHVNYGDNVEKAALESLERRFVRERKEREEKEKEKAAKERREKHGSRGEEEREKVEKDHIREEEKVEKHHIREEENDKAEEEKEREETTVHPLFRTRKTMPTTTTENTREIFTASLRILEELDEQRRKEVTGDSAHYDALYEEQYKDVPTEESKSISSDYHSFERWYDEEMKKPYNATTEHYPWWTYDPNETCEHKYEGVPLDYDRALYSLKMSSRLPPNISAEIDAAYNQKSLIDSDYARALKRSMEEWGRTVNEVYNQDAGPIPERRELREPFEIIQNRYYDLEEKFGVNFEKDVHNYFIKPAKKGLYRFKHWMNENYTTTTRRIAMTWPEQDLNSQEMVDMYKKWLREEKNMSVPDSAGHSIFENKKYQFTADSNYYDETKEDFPWATAHPY